MAERAHVARPYAQAVFQLAQELGDYQSWSEALAFAAEASNDAALQEFAQNPRTSRAELIKLFTDICRDRLSDAAISFLKIVIQNGRLAALPSIASQFEAKRAEAEGIVEAEVISARPIDAEQQGQIAAALEKRLGKRVNLAMRFDESLLGGAIVRAGDLVIDGSARGRLEKLTLALTR